MSVEGRQLDSRAGPGGSILVADDHADNRQTLARLLSLLGHDVTMAVNGRQALDWLRQRPFDLVLLDVIMPEMDGVAALKEIKADPQLHEMPVIMVSGLDEVGSVVRCIEEGAEDYLTKPLDPIILTARINSWLEKKRLRDAERRRSERLAAVENGAGSASGSREAGVAGSADGRHRS
jgi:CheY-like chemotaxis protein